MLDTMKNWPLSSMGGRPPACASRVSAVRDAVDTSVLAVSAEQERTSIRHQRQWQQFIDFDLIEMGRRPEAYGDPSEGLLPPTIRAVSTASNFAMGARDAGAVPPGQVAADGEGGIAIQLAFSDGGTLSFEASPDGSAALWYYPRAPESPVLIYDS